MYKSVDKGNSWSKIVSEVIYGSSIVSFSENYPDVIYVATGDNGDLIKSMNNGQTWEKTGLNGSGLQIYDFIEINSTDSMIALLDHYISDEFDVDYGVVLSVDGGETWNKCNNGLPLDSLFIPHQIVYNEFNQTFYLSLTLGNGGETRLYQLFNGSDEWEFVYRWVRSNSSINGALSIPPNGKYIYFGNLGLYNKRIF